MSLTPIEKLPCPSPKYLWLRNPETGIEREIDRQRWPLMDFAARIRLVEDLTAFLTYPGCDYDRPSIHQLLLKIDAQVGVV